MKVAHLIGGQYFHVAQIHVDTISHNMSVLFADSQGVILFFVLVELVTEQILQFFWWFERCHIFLVQLDFPKTMKPVECFPLVLFGYLISISIFFTIFARNSSDGPFFLPFLVKLYHLHIFRPIFLCLLLDQQKHVHDNLGLVFHLMLDVVKVSSLEVVDHQFEHSTVEVNQSDVLVDQRNYIIIVFVVLLLDQLESFMEKLKGLPLSIKIQQEQSYIVVSCASLLLAQLGSFEETSQRFGLHVQKFQIVGRVKVHIGQLQRLMPIDLLKVSDQYLQHVDRVTNQLVSKISQCRNQPQLSRNQLQNFLSIFALHMCEFILAHDVITIVQESQFLFEVITENILSSTKFFRSNEQTNHETKRASIFDLQLEIELWILFYESLLLLDQLIGYLDAGYSLTSGYFLKYLVSSLPYIVQMSQPVFFERCA